MGNGGALAAGLIGGILGAVLGGGVVLALRPGPAAAPAPSPDALRSAFADALRPLIDELRSERDPRVPDRDGRKRIAAPPAPDESGPAPNEPVRGGTRTLPASTATERAEPLREDGAIWTPEPNFERVRELRSFDEDIRVRQRWLFLSERRALAVFGTPTSSWLAENGECWEYTTPDVETEDEIVPGESFTLVFSRGRLVQVYE